MNKKFICDEILNSNTLFSFVGLPDVRIDAVGSAHEPRAALRRARRPRAHVLRRAARGHGQVRPHALPFVFHPIYYHILDNLPQ